MAELNLMQASNEWASRPRDERYWNLADMLRDAEHARNNSFTSDPIPLDALEVIEHNGELVLRGKSNHNIARPSNWAFSQLMRTINYPMSGIVNPEGGPRIPVELAATVVNHCLQQCHELNTDRRMQLLLERSGGQGPNIIRAITSDKYSRMWDAEVIHYIIDNQGSNWKVPPARPTNAEGRNVRVATADDIIDIETVGMGGLQVQEGDLIGPAGLYRGDRSSFMFFVDPNRAIEEEGGGGGLMRGMFVSNSEVGAGSFKIVKFAMQTVCGNHIVWGAQNIASFKYRHVGDVRERIYEALELAFNHDEDAIWDDEIMVMDWMRNEVIAADRQEVINNLYKLKLDVLLTRKVIGEAYDLATEWRDVDKTTPNTFMGIVNGLTRYSQTLPNADSRMALDLAAASLFELAASQVLHSEQRVTA